MDWNTAPAGVINGASQRFFVALGEDASEVATRINSEPAFLLQLALFAKNGGFEPSTSQKKAREIMGTNMFGIEDAIKRFGVNPSKAQLATLGKVPFSEETLEACKATHVLVAVFPMSILDIRAKVKSELWQAFYNQDWYNKQSFAKEKGEAGWQLIRKTPVSDSTSKTWEEQNELLGKNDEVPSVRAVVYAMVGHYKVTGERLFEKVLVRCSDLGSGGYRVSVGLFGAGGPSVDGYWDGHRDGYLGLSSARK